MNDLFGMLGIIQRKEQYLLDLEREQWERQYQSFIPNVCIHSNCPICEKAKEEQMILYLEQEKLGKQRQEDYKKRCADYLKYFRKLKVKRG